MRIYLAAMYSQRKEMELIAERLTKADHEITSRWIYGDPSDFTPMKAAQSCIADIEYADTVLMFSLPVGTLFKGGGRTFEMGYAFAAGKRIIIIGEKGEHVFHHLPSIEHFNTLDAFISSGVKQTEL